MPVCDGCGQFIYRGERQRHRHPSATPDHAREPIARCVECGDTFHWLPPNFDMRHRYNRTTHLFCGGRIELVAGR